MRLLCSSTLGGILDDHTMCYTLEVSFFSYTNLNGETVPYTEARCILCKDLASRQSRLLRLIDQHLNRSKQMSEGHRKCIMVKPRPRSPTYRGYNGDTMNPSWLEDAAKNAYRWCENDCFNVTNNLFVPLGSVALLTLLSHSLNCTHMQRSASSWSPGTNRWLTVLGQSHALRCGTANCFCMWHAYVCARSCYRPHATHGNVTVNEVLNWAITWVHTVLFQVRHEWVIGHRPSDGKWIPMGWWKTCMHIGFWDALFSGSHNRNNSLVWPLLSNRYLL